MKLLSEPAIFTLYDRFTGFFPVRREKLYDLDYAKAVQRHWVQQGRATSLQYTSTFKVYE